jgi:DNA polymerase-3 subunit delta'
MAWHGIYGHDNVVEQFRRAISRGRLATSFLFAGPEGVGKRTFALKLAQALFCQTRYEAALDPCERCPSCAQVAAMTHPDLLLVAKPEGKAEIPVELFIGDREHRMREGLCHDIGIKPFMGGHRVAIIDDADYLNEEGANSLLKTLEEPPPRSILILLNTSPAKQLPTIRSRCQLIRFRPLPTDTVAELLIEKGLVADSAEARRLASQSGGSVQRAVELAAPELWEFRDLLYQQLADPSLDSVKLAAALVALLEKAGKASPAGKESQAKRARLRQVAEFAAKFYEQLLRSRSGAAAEGDLGPGQERWRGDAATAATCLERCLDAAEQIERYVHQTTLVECWLNDLARTTQR